MTDVDITGSIAAIEQQVRDGLLRKSEGRRKIAELKATRKAMGAYAASVDQHRKTPK
jgi:hypothetical protein